MKIACISDLHGFLPDVQPDTDVLIIAGDIVAAIDRAHEIEQIKRFGHWLTDLNGMGIEVVGIAGNHDFLLCENWRIAEALPWHYLQESGVTIGGLKFWGTPWTPYFGGWAFNAPQHDSDELFLTEIYRAIPDDTDVIISHGPPAGIMDRVGTRRVGSKAFNRRLQQMMPRLAVFGHIHHERGIEVIEGVICVNASVTEVRRNNYEHAHPPIYINANESSTTWTPSA